MMFYNRRMYINRYPVPQNQIAANDSEEVQKDSETKRDDNTEDNKKIDTRCLQKH